MRFVLITLLMLNCTTTWAGIIFSDNFEAGISPLWTRVVGPTAVGQSPSFFVNQNPVHSGSFAATTNSYDLYLNRNLAAPQTNVTFESWIYDTGFTNQESLIGVSTNTNNSSLTSVWVGIDGSQSATTYVFGQGANAIERSAIARDRIGRIHTRTRPGDTADGAAGIIAHTELHLDTSEGPAEVVDDLAVDRRGGTQDQVDGDRFAAKK